LAQRLSKVTLNAECPVSCFYTLFMLSVVILSDVMQSVVAPFD